MPSSPWRSRGTRCLPPDETDLYVVPDAKSLPPDFKQYLSPSPLIESNHARIKAIAKQLGEGQTKAWPHVRAIYDWVRKTIQYKKDAPLTGCVEAIDKHSGDCNQLTSTFIAICRASGIPARTVQIPGHCYPEFYLRGRARPRGIGSRPRFRARRISAASSRIRRFCRRATPFAFPCPIPSRAGRG